MVDIKELEQLIKDKLTEGTLDEVVSDEDNIERLEFDEYITHLEHELNVAYDYFKSVQDNILKVSKLEHSGYRIEYYHDKNTNTMYYVNKGKKTIGFKPNLEQ